MNKEKFYWCVEKLTIMLGKCPQELLYNEFSEGVEVSDWLGIIISSYLTTLYAQLMFIGEKSGEPEVKDALKQFIESIQVTVSRNPFVKITPKNSITIN